MSGFDPASSSPIVQKHQMRANVSLNLPPAFADQSVIPAKAGIQKQHARRSMILDTGFRRYDALRRAWN
jgi:hypothetical protein